MYIYIYIYIYIYMCLYVCVESMCVCMFASVYICMCMCIHRTIVTRAHAHTHFKLAYMHTYTHTHMDTCIHTYIQIQHTCSVPGCEGSGKMTETTQINPELKMTDSLSIPLRTCVHDVKAPRICMYVCIYAYVCIETQN